MSLVGSDHDPRVTGHSRAGRDDPRVFPADPRVRHADLARGSVFCKITSACWRGTLVTRGSGPALGSEIIQYLPLLAVRPLSGRYSELRAHIRACRAILISISDEAYIIRRTPGQMKP